MFKALSNQKLIDQYPWFHSITFPDGSVSKGHPTDVNWNNIKDKLPNPAGKTVLDIGAFDGYYSFKMEALGAAQVTAADCYVWGPGPDSRRPTFELAKRLMGSNVEDVYVDIPDLDKVLPPHDIVLFMGVLYHLWNPLEGVAQAAKMCLETLVVQTWVDLKLPQEYAALRLYIGDEFLGDHTNWFVPNPRAVVDMLALNGFGRVNPHIDSFQDQGLSLGLFVASR